METETSETAPDYSSATSEKREAALRALGLSVSSVFVPFSQSKHAKPEKGEKAWRSLNWSVTLSKGGRAIMTTDYAQGEGHCPAYKNPSAKFSDGRVDKFAQENAIKFEIERGVKVRSVSQSGEHCYPRKAIPGPSLLEVCYSLAMDAQSGQESFEDFCSNFGYDADSRKAEATWRACADTYRALGPVLREQVSRIVEGY